MSDPELFAIAKIISRDRSFSNKYAAGPFGAPAASSVLPCFLSDDFLNRVVQPCFVPKGEVAGDTGD